MCWKDQGPATAAEHALCWEPLSLPHNTTCRESHPSAWAPGGCQGSCEMPPGHGASSPFQFMVYEVPGQDLEVDLYDEDPDRDDFLGR